MREEIGIKVTITLVIFLWLEMPTTAQKPAVESFESEQVLEEYQSTGESEVSLSSSHYKFGKSSLKWEWKGVSTLSTSNFRMLSHDESPLAYGDHFPASPTLIMSIYNENPQDEKLKISYKKQNEEQVWFTIDLTFSGWRTIWVPFYEMNGSTPKRRVQVDYDEFSLSVSSDAGKGNIYIDDVVFSQYQDDRHQYPDLVVPFIKEGQDPEKDHWMPQMADLERIEKIKIGPVSAQQIRALSAIEAKLDGTLTIAKKYKVYIDDLTEKFRALNIREKDGNVLGPPLTFKLEQVYSDEKTQGSLKHNDIAEFGKVMKKLANYYDRATAEEQMDIKAMFILGAKYYLDQGWQEGSSGGTRHHIGYNTRELAEGFFIMRKPLEEAGLLNDLGGSLQWLFNLGVILGDEEEFYANIDYLNTQAFYHLLLVFLTEDRAKQHALLSAYSNYISFTLALDNEIGKFKVDGTGWHHNGHYPAYAFGAYRNVPKVIQALAGTSYRISAEGHRNFRKAFLATRLYSQTFDVGFGNAGRHPMGENIKTLKKPYLQMANAGNPDGTSAVDREVASAYLRIWGAEDPLNTTLFTVLNGIQPEQLGGYYTFPYGATAVHRRNNWAAIIKGYSKYVWASEIYVTDNRYGRYPANGTVQLLNEGGNEGSGFRQEGWDWNRYPGGTVIYLPFEELETKASLLMFRSNETFAGMVQQGGNGAFGMVLNENKGSNADGSERNIGFPGKLKARKSVFSFGDKLICIGTNISSVDKKNPVQTNLFQSYLGNKKMKVLTSEDKLSKFPQEVSLRPSAATWLIDPYNNGYHLLSGSQVHVKKSEQHSYHNKYSVRTGKTGNKAKDNEETSGDFATAWIDHGTAPADASYQYVIYPFLAEAEIKQFSKRLENDQSYQILRADSLAHIVADSGTTAYVIFDASLSLVDEILASVSTPSLLMIEEQENHLEVSMTQPDLNFAEKENGKYLNYSRPVELSVTFNGRWKAAASTSIRSIDYVEETTIVTLNCWHGLTEEIVLSR